MGAAWWRIALRSPALSRVTFPTLSIPPREAEEEASIIITRVQATANSVRSFLAPDVCRA
jgi:hypothetical protein